MRAENRANYAEPITCRSRRIPEKTSPLGIVRQSAWTAKLNDIDPQAWLADILAHLQDHPAKRIDELLPWNWKLLPLRKAAARAACSYPARLFNHPARGLYRMRTLESARHLLRPMFRRAGVMSTFQLSGGLNSRLVGR